MQKGNPMFQALSDKDIELRDDIAQVIEHHLIDVPRRKHQKRWIEHTARNAADAVMEILQRRAADDGLFEVKQRLTQMHQLLSANSEHLNNIVFELQSIPPDPAVLRRNRVVI